MEYKTQTLLAQYALSRRHFLKATAIAGGLAATTTLDPAMIAGMALARSVAREEGDPGVANFALSLAHLQNALYRSLVTGSLLSGQALTYAREFGNHEGEHVRALTTAIEDLFQATAVQELSSYNFPAFANQDQAVSTLVDIEDLTAAAYLGAAPLIQSADFLEQAITIHTVEAQHATAVRLLAGLDPLQESFGTPRTREQVLSGINPYVGGSPLPGTGVSETALKAVGVAGGVAAIAAGVALARGSKSAPNEQA